MALDQILLPVADQDGDRVEQLVETALETAVPAGATIVVAHAIPNRDDGLPSPVATIGGSFPHVLSENEYEDLLDGGSTEEDDIDDIVASHEVVESVTDRLENEGVEYAVRGAVGDPDEALIELAAELDVDRLVVGGRSRTPTDKAVFGSVAQTLLLESPCPVTFVRNS